MHATVANRAVLAAMRPPSSSGLSLICTGTLPTGRWTGARGIGGGLVGKRAEVDFRPAVPSPGARDRPRGAVAPGGPGPKDPVRASHAA
jgi:hypothetical protein